MFLRGRAMMEAGVKLGLAPHVADALVRQTIHGAGRSSPSRRRGPHAPRTCHLARGTTKPL